MAWHPPIFLSPNPSSPENIPASAWVTPPPIFPDSFGQFPLAAPAPRDVPPIDATGGLLGGIAKMLAAPAPVNDPWDVAANGLFGGIAKLPAASASPGPKSIAGSRGLLGALANLQPATSNARADAPYLAGSRAFLLPDPIGYQEGNPSYAYVGNDLPNRADPSGPAAEQPPTDETFGAAPDQENASPSVLLVNGDEEEEKEHNKPDPAVFSGLSDKGLTTSPKALPTFPPLLPFFPRPLLPSTSAPQPPPRASLPPPSSSGALSPPSPGQAANSPRPFTTPIGPAPVVAPAEQSTPNTLERLRMHLDNARARLKQDGLTDSQKRSVGGNPRLEAAHKGERIDTFAKESIAKDKSLNFLKVTPRFQFGPDIYDPINNVWYDITTLGQWKGHARKYTPGFGQGTPLFYGDK
jgi:hypothetical protein